MCLGAKFIIFRKAHGTKKNKKALMNVADKSILRQPAKQKTNNNNQKIR